MRESRVIAVAAFALLLPLAQGKAAEMRGIKRKELVARYTFEPGEERAGYRLSWGASITTDPKEVISGKASLKCDTMSSKGIWHEFFWSNPQFLPLKGGEVYFISLKYRVLAWGKEGKFSIFLRTPSAGAWGYDVGHLDLREKPGPVRSLSLIVALDLFDDYSLVLDLFKRGAVVVDDIEVWKVEVDPRTLPPVEIFSPDEGMVLSPEALQLSWKSLPPVTRWEVQLSRTKDFKKPISFRSYRAPVWVSLLPLRGGLFELPRLHPRLSPL